MTASAPTLRFLVSHPAHFIALGFGAGLAPVAPGTFGTLVAIPLAAALRLYGSDAVFAAAIVVLGVAGVWAAELTGRALGVPDHGAIVIDEVVAFLLVLWLVDTGPLRIAVAFVLFRFFDIVKPPPIRQLDTALKNGVGVMLDDLVAAGYTLLVFALGQAAGLRMTHDANRRSPVDPRQIEQAGLNALQTQRQLFYDGWVLRLSAGKAKRARSVNAFFGSTLPLARKIGHCESVYAQHGLPPLFRMTPFDQPTDLEATLAVRGYEAFDETLDAGGAALRAGDSRDRGRSRDRGARRADTFVEAVGDLRQSPAAQRDAHRERLAHSPLDKRCIIVRADGAVVCTAQVAVEDGVAGVYDVVTAEAARGNGYATLACTSLLSWAWQHGTHAAYLQVNADNAPALAIYRKLGFATIYTYHYRGLPGRCE
jgi:phosphatidylglycerophosphatase A/GNAT superfamily N-acetyltransferase